MATALESPTYVNELHFKSLAFEVISQSAVFTVELSILLLLYKHSLYYYYIIIITMLGTMHYL
jgi:hypothetical protein